MELKFILSMYYFNVHSYMQQSHTCSNMTNLKAFYPPKTTVLGIILQPIKIQWLCFYRG